MVSTAKEMPLRSLCVAACLSIATPFLSFHFADHLGSLTLFRAMLAFISMCRSFDMLDEHKATSTCMATRSEVPLVFILLKANSSAPPPLFLCVSCFTVLCLSSGTLFYLASRFYFAKNRFSVLPLFDVTAGVRRGRGSGPHAGLSCFSGCKLFSLFAVLADKALFFLAEAWLLLAKRVLLVSPRCHCLIHVRRCLEMQRPASSRAAAR